MPRLITKAGIKKALEETSTQAELRISTDFYKELEAKTRQLIAQAATRAQKNKRKTVMAKDL